MPPDQSMSGTDARRASSARRDRHRRPASVRHRRPGDRTTHAMATTPHDLFVHRKEAHPQELRQARERAAGAVPARNAARVVPRVPAGRHAPASSARTRACRPRSRRSSRSPATRATRGSSSSSYSLLPPAFDVIECQQRGLTYCSALRAKVRLILMDKEAPKETVKEVKEQEVYMGEIPLMTDNGSFIINGTERVIVSQLHRSPGVFFEHDRGKTHSSGKLLFSARVIPYRGSWLDFEFDPKDFLFFRVDRRRKMPVTTLLKAIGLTNEDILRAVLRVRHVPPVDARARSSSSCPSACAARWRASTSSARTARSSSQKDKRITARHVRELTEGGVKKHRRARRLHRRPRARDQHRRQDHRRDARQGQRRDHRGAAAEAAPTPASPRSRRSTPTTSTRAPYISQTLRTDDTPDQTRARASRSTG